MENVILRLEPWNKGKLMEGMMTYQRNLVNMYLDRNMLPPYHDFDLTQGKNQDFLRGLMGFFLEELVEGIQEWNKMVEVFHTYVYTSDEATKKFHTLQDKLTEELADTMHFMLELLLYSHITPDDMLGYYHQKLRGEGVWEDFQSSDALTTGMMYSRHLIITNDEARVAVFNAYTIPVKDPEVSKASQKVGPELTVLIERMCWAITETLFAARNFLKRKYWKTQENDGSDFQAYQEKLMEVWVFLLNIYDAFGMNPTGIYETFENKNIINQQRVVNKY